MESIIALALEYTLKYWLKSFSRDQFKLQGRTAQFSNLDINGDALHSSVGLPPAMNVATAKVGRLQITLPSVSNVQIEPIVVQIDRIYLVLEENLDVDASKSSCSTPSPSASTSSGWGSGYGFADKAVKPLLQSEAHLTGSPWNGMKEDVHLSDGIEAVVSKNELQNLALTCKSEVDSMGRITAGIIRLLNLEGSVGQVAIDQLSNLDQMRCSDAEQLAQNLKSIQNLLKQLRTQI